MANCSERDRLTEDAHNTLTEVIQLTQEQIAALQARDQEKLLAADRGLELAFGKKERAFGALQQHTKEHGC